MRGWKGKKTGKVLNWNEVQSQNCWLALGSTWEKMCRSQEESYGMQDSVLSKQLLQTGPKPLKYAPQIVTLFYPCCTSCIHHTWLEHTSNHIGPFSKHSCSDRWICSLFPSSAAVWIVLHRLLGLQATASPRNNWWNHFIQSMWWQNGDIAMAVCLSQRQAKLTGICKYNYMQDYRVLSLLSSP